jgi:hypothetical protein
LKDIPDEVTITRRHHPLKGKKFVVLKEGRETIIIQHSDGTSMRIPRQWTDADGESADDFAPRTSVFTVDSLRKLCELVELLLHR